MELLIRVEWQVKMTNFMERTAFMITTTTKKGALQISSDVKDFTIQNKNVQCLMKREKKLY